MTRISAHQGKRNNQNFQELLDTGSELTLVRDPVVVRVGDYGGQETSGVLAQAHLAVGPRGPPTTSPVLSAWWG